MLGISDKWWEDGGGFVSFLRAFVTSFFLLFPQKDTLRKLKLIGVEMCLGEQSIFHWFG